MVGGRGGRGTARWLIRRRLHTQWGYGVDVRDTYRGIP